MDIAADVGEQKRPLAAHLFRIALHDFQACADIRSQINLVYDEISALSAVMKSVVVTARRAMA